MLKKPKIVLKLIQQAINANILADFLMDTCFTHEPLIRGALDEGLHVISIAKGLN